MKTESLPCKLTDKEVLERTTTLLDTMTARDKLEYEKIQFTAKHKEAMTVVGSQVNELRGIVSARIEYRPIEIAESPDYKRGIVEVIRLDTQEIVRTRQMSAEERQSPLSFESHDRA